MDILPLDMVNLILHRLSNYDLNQYAATSKQNYEIVNKIWRQKYMNEKIRQTKFFKRIFIDEHVENWQLEYNKLIKDYFVSNLNNYLDLATEKNKKEEKLNNIKTVFEFVIQNKFVLDLKSMNIFKSTVRNKLLEFSESFCSFENEISQIYLPLLE
jgi:hypothetical protein